MRAIANTFSTRAVAVAAIGVVLLIAAGVWWWLSPAMPRVAWNALNSADSYQLFSINPQHADSPDRGPTFYGNPVLGSMEVNDPAVRAKLNSALDGGAGDKRSPFACFEPRHGIRVRHAGVTTDFVICFQCGWVHVNHGDTSVATFVTSDSPQAVFDDVLTKAKVPLATR